MGGRFTGRCRPKACRILALQPGNPRAPDGARRAAKPPSHRFSSLSQIQQPAPTGSAVLPGFVGGRFTGRCRPTACRILALQTGNPRAPDGAIAQRSRPPTGSAASHRFSSQAPTGSAVLPGFVGGRFTGRCRPKACRILALQTGNPRAPDGAIARRSRPPISSVAKLPPAQWLYRVLWEAGLPGDAGRRPAGY